MYVGFDLFWKEFLPNPLLESEWYVRGFLNFQISISGKVEIQEIDQSYL